MGAGALALAVAACGGGGGSAPPPTTGGGGGTPAPSPSPSPTPTSVSYTKFDDLTGDREFNTACSLNPTISGGQGFGGITLFTDFFTFAFTEASETWRVAGPTLSDTFDSSFGPSDISSQQAGEFTLYRREITVNGNSVPEFFVLITPQLANGSVDYVRGGDAVLFGINSQTQAFYRCVFGVPTELDDALPASTVSYDQFVSANGNARVTDGAGVVTQYNIEDTQIEVTANPANGEITVTLDVRGREVTRDPTTGQITTSSTVTQLGTFTGNTAIDGTIQGFEGGLSDSNGQFVGEYSGWFFGPQGIELGIALHGTQNRNDASTLTFGVSMAGPRG
ncbi:hypothetical protein ACI5KX_10475 [Erythrobacter sp. GH1-10]|uniref:hypothetical protein n=1 Tax=Erythrobacter sp. GH1-10 TaxID=3349334 RepID=UPI003877A925